MKMDERLREGDGRRKEEEDGWKVWMKGGGKWMKD
jgi:hypothetical protein